MDIRTKIAGYFVRFPFIREAVLSNADLSVFKEKPPYNIFVRNIIGLFLILFSYVIGWPLIFVLGAISVYAKEPLIVIIGGPVAYGISHVVFWAGMFIAGAHYTMLFLRWAVRAGLMKLLGRERVTASAEKSALYGEIKD